MTFCCKFPLYIDKIEVKSKVNCITQTARTRIQLEIKSLYGPQQKMELTDLTYVVIVPSLNGIMTDICINYKEKCDIHPSCFVASKGAKGLLPQQLELIQLNISKYTHSTPGFIIAGEISKYDGTSKIIISYIIDHVLIHLPSNSLVLYSLGKDLFRDIHIFEMEMEIISKEKVGNIKFSLPMISSFECKKEENSPTYVTTLNKFKVDSKGDKDFLTNNDLNVYIYTDISGDYVAQYDNGLYLQMVISKGLFEYRDKYLSIIIDLTLRKEFLEWCKAYLIGLLILCETRNALSGFNIYTVESTTTSFQLNQLNNKKYFKNPTHEDFKNAIKFIENLQPSENNSVSDMVISQFTPFSETTDVVFATQSRSSTLYSSPKFKTHYLFSGELLNLHSAWSLNNTQCYFDLVGPNRLSDMERGIWGLYSSIVSQKLGLINIKIEYEDQEGSMDVLDYGTTLTVPSFTYVDGNPIRLFFPITKRIHSPIKIFSTFRNQELTTEVTDEKIIGTQLEFYSNHSFILEYNQMHVIGDKELMNKAKENVIASTYSILDASPLVSCYFSQLKTKSIEKNPVAEVKLIPIGDTILYSNIEQGDYEPDDKIKHFITSTLNKLSEITFANVVTDLLTIDYSDSCVIKYLARTIVNKASIDLKYIPYYADLCSSLSLFISSNFTQTLLNILNIEFNVRNTTKSDILTKTNALSSDVINRILSQSHIRFSAIIRFIGHLNLRGFLPSHFMVTIIRDLVKDSSDQSFEYLNILLRIIGKIWDESNDLNFVINEAFDTIEFALKHPQNICNRTRFMLMDLVDLRKMNWESNFKKPPSLAKPGDSFDPEMQTIEEGELPVKKEEEFLE